VNTGSIDEKNRAVEISAGVPLEPAIGLEFKQEDLEIRGG